MYSQNRSPFITLKGTYIREKHNTSKVRHQNSKNVKAHIQKAVGLGKLAGKKLPTFAVKV